MKPWPEPFQNLRSTRETELMEKFPAHVVCGWIGNSEAIALKHYLQVADDHFERAVRGEAEIGPETAATPTNTTAQKVAQHAHARGSSEQQAAVFLCGKLGATNAKAPGLPGPATSCDTAMALGAIPMNATNTCSVPHGVSNTLQNARENGAIRERATHKTTQFVNWLLSTQVCCK